MTSNDGSALMNPASPKSRTVTLADVAERAGMTKAAVSQALNGTGTLSESTRTRLKSIAHEMGYVANRQAASLRNGKTFSIGYVWAAGTDFQTNERWAGYFARQMYALVTEAEAHGFTVSVIPDRSPELVVTSRVDALYYIDPQVNDPLIAEALRIQLPILSNARIDQPHCGVFIDSGYRDSTLFALAQLAESGAKRIGLLTEERGYPSDEIAEDTYRDWCSSHGQDAIVVRGNWGRTNLTESIAELMAANVDAIYSYYEEGPRIREILDREYPERGREVRLIAAVMDDPSANLTAGVSSIVFQPERIPSVGLTALLKSLEQRTTPPKIIAMPWEFVTP